MRPPQCAIGEGTTGLRACQVAVGIPGVRWRAVRKAAASASPPPRRPARSRTPAARPAPPPGRPRSSAPVRAPSPRPPVRNRRGPRARRCSGQPSPWSRTVTTGPPTVSATGTRPCRCALATRSPSTRSSRRRSVSAGTSGTIPASVGPAPAARAARTARSASGPSRSVPASSRSHPPPHHRPPQRLGRPRRVQPRAPPERLPGLVGLRRLLQPLQRPLPGSADGLMRHGGGAVPARECP